MRFYFIIFLTIASSITEPLFAQDTITFLNGKVIIGNDVDSDDSNTFYTVSKNGKSKRKVIETINLFSVKYANNTIDTLYSTNLERDFILTPYEMHLFILGEQDAKVYFKPNLNALGGFAFGATLGYVLHDGFYVAGIPLVYTVASGVSRINVKNVGNRPFDVLTHPAYQEGFIKVARAKKSFYALVSSTVGTIIGAYIGHLKP